MEKEFDYQDAALKFAADHKEFNNQSTTTEENQVNQIEPTTKNEQISDDVKAKAMVELVTDPSKAIKANLSGKISQKIQTDDNVQRRLDETATKVIDSSLTVEENKATANSIASEDDVNVANFEKYKNEYAHHGIENKVDKVWKTKIITIMNDFWFVIFAIISFFTIVPVSIFIERLKALKGFVKAVFIILGCILIAGILFALVVLIFHFAGIDFLKQTK